MGGLFLASALLRFSPILSIGLITSLTNGVLCLGSDAGVVTFTPDNVSTWNKYNIALTYWWTRYSVNKTYIENSTTVSTKNTFAVSSNRIYNPYVYQVSKSISINQSNGVVSLTSPSSLTPSDDTLNQFDGAYVQVNARSDWYDRDDSPYLTVAYPGTSMIIKMIDCYQTSGNGMSEEYIASRQPLMITASLYYSQGAYIDRISSTNPSQYPSNNYSGAYWYISDGSSEGPGTFIESVYSTNASAYPDNGAANGYWYVRQ